MAKKIKHRNMHYFLVEIMKGKPPIKIGVPVVNATKPLKFHRTEIDVLSGKQGMAATCANILAVERSSDMTIYHAEFTQTRAYIVDRLKRDGTMARCVRYEHDQGPFQKKFDKKPKRAIIEAGLAEANVTLWPPKIRQSQSGLTTYVSTRDKSRGTRIPYNGARRLWQAGFDLSKLAPVTRSRATRHAAVILPLA